MFRRNAPSTQTLLHAQANTLLKGDSRSVEVSRKWRVPPTGGHILSLGKEGLFVQRSEHFVCMNHRETFIPGGSDNKEEFLKAPGKVLQVPFLAEIVSCFLGGVLLCFLTPGLETVILIVC